MISLLIFLPALVAVGLIFFPSTQHKLFRVVALITACVQFIIGIAIYTNYPIGSNGFALVEKAEWINFSLGSWGSFTVNYWVGVDGMSLPLILMSCVIFVTTNISSWSIDKNIKGFYILMLILNTSILGSFAAMDTLLFFVFFEFMLIPMYFLIGIWGGERREYASVKFFIYTLLGSILILIAIIALYSSSIDPDNAQAQHTFGLPHLLNSENFQSGSLLDKASTESIGFFTYREWAFLLLFFGFAIKIPVVPLHTWLPDAHVEAPTSISILLAALLLKVGGYGMIRFAYSIFPSEANEFSLLAGVLAVISIIYGALNAMASKDLKRMIAYSSISHMGFVLLGVASATTEGIAGATYQMVSHSLITAMLFAVAGVVYDRTHDRNIANYSGLFSVAPKFTSIVLISFFAAMGMPGFSAFIGEILVFFGSFASHKQNELIPVWIPIVSTLGLLLTAGYFSWTIQRMFFGKTHVHNQLAFLDLTVREWLIFAPLALLTLTLGIYPQPLIDIINPFATSLAKVLQNNLPASP